MFAAIGSALNHSENVKVNISDLYEQLSKGIKMSMEIKRLDPLFNNEREYKEFTERHNKDCVKKGDLATYKGNCYLGIDSGSTTTKAALVAEVWNPSLLIL